MLNVCIAYQFASKVRLQGVNLFSVVALSDSVTETTNVRGGGGLFSVSAVASNDVDELNYRVIPCQINQFSEKFARPRLRFSLNFKFNKVFYRLIV